MVLWAVLLGLALLSTPLLPISLEFGDECFVHRGLDVDDDICFVHWGSFNDEDPLPGVPERRQFPCRLVSGPCPFTLGGGDGASKGLVRLSLVFGYLSSSYGDLAMADEHGLLDHVEELVPCLFCEELDNGKGCLSW